MLDLMRYEPLGVRRRRPPYSGWFFGPSIFDRLATDEGMVVPKVDITEGDNEYTLKADVPGYGTDEIKVTVEDGRLRVSGEHSEEKEEKKENYHLKERRSGSFVRTFVLPENTEGEKIEAKVKDGVLLVTIPKGEAAKPKEIEVKVH